MAPDDSVPSTHLSLLRDLAGPDNPGEAWRRFEDLYTPLIRRWCKRRRLPNSDLDDLCQEVLLKVYRSLPTYEPSRGPFHAWLGKVAHNALTDHFRRQRQRPGDRGSGDSDVRDRLDEIEAPDADDLGAELGQRLDGDLQAALERARCRVDDRTWQAFYRVLAEERPPAEVADQLGLSRAAVYQAVYRVKNLAIREYARAGAGAAGEEKES
jgi:RNA polymerase sigma-70 factor (ECF subfamily)